MTAIKPPLLRGRLHFIACVLAMPAGLYLVLQSSSTPSRVACVFYAGSLFLAFGTSAGYHCLARKDRTRNLLRRLDHAMIFVLIGGTYTPVCLIALPRSWGLPLLSVVAGGAVLGIVTKVVAFDRSARLSYVLYLLLGWAGLAVAPVLAQVLDGPERLLLLLGGLAYTAGVPVLISHRPDPWPRVFGYHEIWHVFTVVAAGLHFAAVARFAS